MVVDLPLLGRDCSDNVTHVGQSLFRPEVRPMRQGGTGHKGPMIDPFSPIHRCIDSHTV